MKTLEGSEGLPKVSRGHVLTQSSQSSRLFWEEAASGSGRVPKRIPQRLRVDLELPASACFWSGASESRTGRPVQRHNWVRGKATAVSCCTTGRHTQVLPWAPREWGSEWRAGTAWSLFHCWTPVLLVVPHRVWQGGSRTVCIGSPMKLHWVGEKSRAKPQNLMSNQDPVHPDVWTVLHKTQTHVTGVMGEFPALADWLVGLGSERT